MNWVTILWSANAATCLSLGSIQLLAWLHDRPKNDRLCFALAAFGTAGIATCELLMMQAESVAQFNPALRWLHAAAWVTFVSLIGFVHSHLHAGRLWLSSLAIATRSLSLLINFLLPINLNYREMLGLSHIQFLNQSISTAHGIPSPWMLTGQLALTLFLLFVIDATVTCWRRGDPRQSLILGGTIVFFVFAATLQVIFVFWGLVVSPITASLFFFGIVVAMGYALSRDLLHATQLSQELQHAERQSHAQTLELAHLSRIALLNELSGSLAHELNQPLTVILSNAQAAQRFLAQPHPNYPELSEALQDIVTANHHASSVIQHLRTLFKKGPPQLQSLQINDVILASLSLVQADLRHSHTIIETQLAENLPPITGDRVQLAQVFLNLLTNARDAIAKQPAPQKIIVSTTLLPNLHIHVRVHDSGPGIPPHQLQQIFHPFFTTKIHGLGLGLGLCQTLLASHHSLLSAENHPNGGACFHFSLPSITHSNP